MLYGLKQSGRQWKKWLHEVLTKLGFRKSFADDCLYVLRESSCIVLVLLYVDDIAVAGLNVAKIGVFRDSLNKDFEITYLGELEFMLGILVT